MPGAKRLAILSTVEKSAMALTTRFHTAEPMPAHAIVQNNSSVPQQPPAAFRSNCASGGYNMRLACVSYEDFC